MSFIEKLFQSKKEVTKPEFEFMAHKKDGFNKLGVNDLINDKDFLYSRSSNGYIKKWRKLDNNLIVSFEKPENVDNAIANLVIEKEYLFSGYISRIKLGLVSIGTGPNNILVYNKNGRLLYELKHEKLKDEPGYERLEYIFVKDSYIYGMFNSEWTIGSDTSGFDYVRITIWNYKGQQVNDYKFKNCPPSTFTSDDNFIYALNQSQTGSPFGLHVFEYKEGEIVEKDVKTSIKPEASLMRVGGSLYKYDKLLVSDKNIYYLSNRKIKCLNKSNFNTMWEHDIKFTQISSACIQNAYVCFSGDSSINILNKEDGHVLRKIETDSKINCITTNEKIIYCGLIEGLINIFYL